MFDLHRYYVHACVGCLLRKDHPPLLQLSLCLCCQATSLFSHHKFTNQLLRNCGFTGGYLIQQEIFGAGIKIPI